MSLKTLPGFYSGVILQHKKNKYETNNNNKLEG